MSTAMPDLVEETEVGTHVAPETPWKTLLWNDDVNDFDFVVKVLQRILKKDEGACEQFAFTAHTEGKVAVFNGTLEEAQEKATQLGAACLWATVEKE